MDFEDWPDELSAEQIEELAEQLEEMEARLTARLEAHADSAKPVDLDQPIGRLSRMDELQRQQMAQAQKRREKANLQKVRSALDRIRRDNYGFCMECEIPIGYPRLKAQPHAVLCRDCQGAREM